MTEKKISAKDKKLDARMCADLKEGFGGRGPVNQALRIYNYWRELGQTPENAYLLAVAAWSGGRRYTEMKRRLGVAV